MAWWNEMARRARCLGGRAPVRTRGGCRGHGANSAPAGVREAPRGVAACLARAHAREFPLRIAAMAQAPGLCRSRGGDARARHRRQQRCLLGDRRHRSPAAAVPRRRTSDENPSAESEEAITFVAPPRLADWDRLNTTVQAITPKSPPSLRTATAARSRRCW
jgi:hypothetical protein